MIPLETSKNMTKVWRGTPLVNIVSQQTQVKQPKKQCKVNIHIRTIQWWLLYWKSQLVITSKPHWMLNPWRPGGEICRNLSAMGSPGHLPGNSPWWWWNRWWCRGQYSSHAYLPATCWLSPCSRISRRRPAWCCRWWCCTRCRCFAFPAAVLIHLECSKVTGVHNYPFIQPAEAKRIHTKLNLTTAKR